MKPAITVDGISKQFRLGTARPNGYRTLRESITDGVQAGWDRVRGRARRSVDRAADGEFWALKDVSFEVQPGEVVGIIGRNGSGKSTLLKVLSQIYEPTRGRAVVRGRLASLLEVGTGFHPELTGRENIYLNGSILGMTRREIARKFDEIVAFSEIEQFLDTPVKRYSSGMYVRLAFAVAAHLEPDILIVDEVLAVGDARFQKKCLGKMREVGSSGRTVLFVSHNLGTVRSLCTRGVWLAAGSVSDLGSAIEVSDRYARSCSQSLAASVSLRSIHSRAGGTDLRVCSVEVNNGEAVLHGEALRVRMTYETTRDVDDVSIGFGFSDMYGTRLLSIDSDLSHARRAIQGGMRGTVELSLPCLPLQPGQYLLDVGARSGDYHALDYIPACTQIEVLPGPRTPGCIIRSGGGGVRLEPGVAWASCDNI